SAPWPGRCPTGPARAWPESACRWALLRPCCCSRRSGRWRSPCCTASPRCTARRQGSAADSERRAVVQGVGLGAVVGLLDSGVGVVDGAHADFLAGEAQAEAQAILELERRAQVVALVLGALEQRHADARLDIGPHPLAGELVDEHR